MGMLLELETLLHQSMYDCTCTWYSNENAILQDYFTSKAGDGCSLLHCLLRWSLDNCRTECEYIHVFHHK